MDRTKSLRLLPIALVLTTLAAACGEEVFGPPSVATYQLTTADGRILPYRRNFGSGHSSTLFSDVIVVSADLRYERTSVVEVETSASVAALQEIAPTEVGLLVPVGERFVMQFECPDLALCVPPDTIAFTASGARIDGSYLLGGVDLRYGTR